MVLSALLFLIPSSADNPQKQERDQDEQKLFTEEKLYSQHCPVLFTISSSGKSQTEEASS